MAQQPIELILVRQLAVHLTTAAFLVSPDGDVVYNEAAAALLGLRGEETGELPLAALHALLEAADGTSPPEPPLTVALDHHRPTHGRFRLHRPDGSVREVTVVAFPLDGHRGRPLGAMALVWDLDEG